eukprot:6481663-Amphidinium_carterae.5
METLARLALLPVVEISIEAKHAFAKCKLRDKTNVSGSLFSMTLRMPSLRKFLHDSPQHSYVISDHMAELRKKTHFVACFAVEIFNAASMSDLTCIQRALHSQSPLSWKIVRRAFYHCDAESQFMPVRGFKQRRARRNVPAEVLRYTVLI